MSLNPDDLLLFARVAESGSFTRAAERLKLPKSTVSRRVASLEGQLGERLLQRTTRRLGLTDFGQALLEHARQVAEQTDAACALAQYRQAEPSGRLRISMPADFASWLMADLLARFVERYPQVSIDIDLSPRRVDLVAENFDLAVRMGNLPEDSGLVARRLCEMSASLYAGTSYLAAHGTPAIPDDLTRHSGLHLLDQRGERVPWTLVSGEQRWSGMPRGGVGVNSVGMQLRLAQAGAGLALLTDRYVAAAGSQTGLVRVLPQWQAPPITAWAVLPGRRLMAAKTRVFIDTLVELFAHPNCDADVHA
ncbi:MAG: LysR family transcriptional regulator [Rhodocyclaceae bacterium]|nr:LysR family transcriptional regulator [Rhodocyclaceae bacterium]MBX3670024.1 LysR family transcriptional regulator [Rhodocyclaceae bacterium]